jgi:hypothetical protein
MGNADSKIRTANFDNIKENTYILIHVMDETDQSVLIKGTLTIEKEITILNSLLSSSKQRETNIIIYGKNTDDFHKVLKRYKQLCDLGFDAFVYIGGLFEWLLLQEIYGMSVFPIEFSHKQTGFLDILKFAPRNANI